MRNESKLKNVDVLLKTGKADYFRNTMLSSIISFGVTVLFALYHGYLGLLLSSVWHGSICVFYILLVVIRGSVFLAEKGNRSRDKLKQVERRQKTLVVSSVLLLTLDLLLILPIFLLVTMQKPVNIGLIPSIAMAAYTTYKITMASVHIRRQKRCSSGNILVTELRTINFIDAMVSVLTLQNTLIMVNQAKNDTSDMIALSAVSGAMIYIVIVAVTVGMLRQGIKRK